MNLSYTTVITIHLSLCILLMILLPLLTCRYCLKHIGTGCLMAFCLTVMIRALFPVECSLSRTIPDSTFIPVIQDLMIFPVMIKGRKFYLFHVLFFIWLAVAFFLLCRKFVLCHRMQKLIRRMPDCEDQIIREGMILADPNIR